jgi:hypothetical protein
MGAKDRVPRRNSRWHGKFEEMAQQYDASEYLCTNDEKQFTGDARQLLQLIYRSEKLPVRIRLYAASKAMEFEPVTVDVTATEEARLTLEELADRATREIEEAFREYEPPPRPAPLPPPAPEPEPAVREFALEGEPVDDEARVRRLRDYRPARRGGSSWTA